MKPSTTTQRQRQRVAQVFERLDRTVDHGGVEREREALIAQTLETLEASGDTFSRADVEAAVDAILAQEREDAQRVVTPTWWQKIPAWGWPPIFIFGLILAFPVARLLVRLLEVVVRVL